MSTLYFILFSAIFPCSVTEVIGVEPEKISEAKGGLMRDPTVKVADAAAVDTDTKSADSKVGLIRETVNKKAFSSPIGLHSSVAMEVDAKGEVRPEGSTNKQDFDIDEDGSDEASLEEMEAVTIGNALVGKAPPRRRRRAINCKWADWTDGPCSKTCGVGILTKKRVKDPEKAHNGTECVGEPEMKEVCEAKDCPAPTPAPTPFPTFPPKGIATRGSHVDLRLLSGLLGAALLRLL